MMIRTALIALLTVFLLQPFCTAAEAKTIAAILASDLPRYRDAHRAFVKALSANGYSSPDTEIILQSPNPDHLSWSNTVRKFNAYRPALIVAYGAPAAAVAMKESDGIPVVSVDTYIDPGKGSIGVSSRVPLITLLKTLTSIRQVRKLGVLYTAREAGSSRQLDDLRAMARQNSISLVEANVTSTAGLDAALAAMTGRVDALFVTESSVASKMFDRIVDKSRERSIPVLATMPDAAERGAVLSMEINPQEQGTLAAEVAIKLLAGASRERLTLVTPKRIDLVINLAAAKEIGINIPFQVLSAATRVIK